SVKVENHKITELKDMAPRDSIYVTYATGVFRKIINQQTPDVDAITGATTTSKAFMKAVENALNQGK
ncbi:MAG: FMN-binding protein, partial [Lachnospira sp.]|nr:FMN-binding protein [Lachnospira sp.]